jgi:hypothetical protein
MPYNFKLAMSASISPTVVEEMIRAAVEEQTGKKISRFEVQMNEGQFDGYVVYFENESPRAVVKPTGSGFRVTSYN